MAHPKPTAEAIADLRAIGRYLDHVSEIATDDDAHTIAEQHAIRLWRAVSRVEALADLVEDMTSAIGRPDLNQNGRN